MGIPSYFSYIIKNHMQILTKLSRCKQSFHNLYLDCNSIIYDSIRELQKSGSLKPVVADNYEPISALLCTKIQQYIDAVRPSNTVYIAFDGVAPFAKMNQQKSRRYRSAFLEHHNVIAKSTFNSALITPGTAFMDYLSKYVTARFSPKFIVSASDIPGEGEHKLFQHIRDNHLPDQNTVIYGLDADLLMLSIFHSDKTNLFVYREAPEFAKSLNADLENGEAYVLDIARLCTSISTEMKGDSRRVFDYAFLCFMLGNDFLPHFPALNIRTTGMHSLMYAYSETLGKDPSALIIKNSEIQWENFKKVLICLAKHEEPWIQTEYTKRANIRVNMSDPDKEVVFNNTPLIYRATEHYINPSEHKWQSRYYKTLFTHGDVIKDICTNYFEGLEWVFRYYTNQCFDWRWRYKYHYPPLLVDLAAHSITPLGKYFAKPVFNPFTHSAQLDYVIPPVDCSFSDIKFEWAFCRYFWEGHLVET
jgi:5'-3' exonuclease